MNLNSLPDLCLRRILSFLPLRDLLRSHEVCRLWASLQRSACVNRRQVAIYIGRSYRPHIFKSRFRMPYEEVLDPSTPADHEPRLDARNVKDNFNLLQFAWFDSVTCDKLVSLLPNVIELKVGSEDFLPPIQNFEYPALMNQIITLLTLWRSTLAVFTVYISFCGNKPRNTAKDYRRLFHAINQLDSLRRLTLSIDIEQSFPDIEPFQFPVLLHLEEFSFLGNEENLKVFLPSLIKHGGPESTLKRISFANDNCLFPSHDNVLPFDFTNQMGDWMRKVVHFPHLTISKFDSNLLSILDKFPRLECITIKVDSLVKIPQILKHLESLRHLTYLVMYLVDKNSEYSMNEDMNDDPCLPSVRVLVIHTCDLAHNDLHPFSWPSILPNLEILHYRDSPLNCKICSIKRTRYDCIQKALSPWTRCARIRRIYSGDLHNPQRRNLSELRQYLGDE